MTYSVIRVENFRKVRTQSRVIHVTLNVGFVKARLLNSENPTIRIVAKTIEVAEVTTS